jgi:UDP-N-acetylglucosamine transferase subunit ALG13
VPSSERDAPFVLVTVGTEHYPFDRLITWVDGWRSSPREQELDLVIQYGVSRPPSEGDVHAFMPFPDMLEAIEHAEAVVTHGGTGSIMLTRHAGAIPIVVPRRHDLGEHVDDHQVAFAQRLALRGDCELVESEERLHQLLDDVASGRRQRRAQRADAEAAEATRRFADLVDELLVGSAR